MDRVSKAIRSKIMAAVRSRGNKTTEQKMTGILRANHLRGYRTQWPVTGKPDFAWPKRKIALFIDGCFWHGCPTCNRPSKTNVRFWRAKIRNNRRRDAKVSRSLRKNGWVVLRVWECRVGTKGTVSRIARAVLEPPRTSNDHFSRGDGRSPNCRIHRVPVDVRSATQTVSSRSAPKVRDH